MLATTFAGRAPGRRVHGLRHFIVPYHVPQIQMMVVVVVIAAAACWTAAATATLIASASPSRLDAMVVVRLIHHSHDISEALLVVVIHYYVIGGIVLLLDRMSPPTGTAAAGFSLSRPAGIIRGIVPPAAIHRLSNRPERQPSSPRSLAAFSFGRWTTGLVGAGFVLHHGLKRGRRRCGRMAARLFGGGSFGR